MENGSYTLIIDESPEVYPEKLDLTIEDRRAIAEKFVEIHSDGTVSWKENEHYAGRFSDIMNLCKEKRLRGFITSKEIPVFLETVPRELFYAFKEIFIFTYLFPAQLFFGYLESERIEYDSWYVTEDY